MKKCDKEKYAIEVRLKEIESLDRDTTISFFKTITAFGIFIAFLFSTGLLDINNREDLFVVFIFVSIFLFVVVFSLIQSSKHVKDCYDGLFIAIKEDKILQFNIPKLKGYDFLFYRKRYK